MRYFILWIVVNNMGSWIALSAYETKVECMAQTKKLEIVRQERKDEIITVCLPEGIYPIYPSRGR